MFPHCNIIREGLKSAIEIKSYWLIDDELYTRFQKVCMCDEVYVDIMSSHPLSALRQLVASVCLSVVSKVADVLNDLS